MNIIIGLLMVIFLSISIALCSIFTLSYFSDIPIETFIERIIQQ